MNNSRVDRLLQSLAFLQERRAGWIVIAAFLLSGTVLPLVFELGINSAWTALLPANAPSLQDLEQARGRVSGLSTLTIAVESRSKNLVAMQRFADALVPRLRQLPGVHAVDWNVGAYEDFVWDHRHLFADLSTLRELESELEARLEWERARANPFFIDLEEAEPPDPAEVARRMQNRAEDARARSDRFPDGYLVHPDRDLLVLFVRCDLSNGDSVSTGDFIGGVRKLVSEVGPKQFGDDLTVAFSGDMIVGLEEQQAIAEELLIATSITIVGVFLVIYLFFRRWRAIPLLGLALIPPVLLTFAIGETQVDSLNTATAFLGSIIIGNGINPFIIWLARYFEERRGHRSLGEALVRTHRETWLATLIASSAAGIAYGSLIATDFRGFRDFGIIGSIGMLFCWIAAFVLLPALVIVTERWRPLAREDQRRAGIGGAIYGAIFSRVAETRTRAVLWSGAVLTLTALGFTAHAIMQDPIEYDFSRLRSERRTEGRSIHSRVYAIVGPAQQGNNIAVLTPSPALAADLERRLERQEHGLWKTVHTAWDLLPREQEKKRELLASIRDLMLEVRPYVEDDVRADIDEHLPPDYLPHLTLEDIPLAAARPFTERDGTRGRILLVEEGDEFSVWDGKYLIAWSEQLRATPMANGETPLLIGRATVFADIIAAVFADGPKAVGVAFLATFVLVLLSFRARNERVLAVLALLTGIVWMAGTMAALGMKLNFLNFVAFPITFGNGVDYGVNVLRRYARERHHGNAYAVRTSIRETGGAVVLCALTTVIGYSSLFASANLGINSFGAAMAISEITCVLAAVLFVPAILLARRARD